MSYKNCLICKKRIYTIGLCKKCRNGYQSAEKKIKNNLTKIKS